MQRPRTALPAPAMERETMRGRFRGALAGCMLGDAFGRVLEGATSRDLRAGAAVERRAASTDVWAYSDDTEMMCGVAESLLDRDGADPEHLLRTLAGQCDRARGYGHGTLRVFEALAAGTPWRRTATVAWAEGSRGNGGAVRVAPIACAYHDDAARLGFAAQASAAVTHAHPIARHGALLQATALAHVLALGRPADFDAAAFVRALRAVLPPGEIVFTTKLASVGALLDADAAPETLARELGNGVTADVSVPLALYGVARWSPSFEAVVTNLARCGGDVDTIGAMGGALAGALLGEAGLPQAWLARLENGARGRDHVLGLADRLAARWEQGRAARSSAAPRG